MKYRMLTNEELTHLEEDLKQFLIVHGLHTEEWKELNKQHPDKVLELVGLFSDTVLQKVYEKLRFIEHRMQNSCMVFNLKENQISMISINAKDDSVDLSAPETIHDALVNKANSLTFFRNSKKYSKSREMEIHEMLEQGCVNSSEAFWMQLEKAIS